MIRLENLNLRCFVCSSCFMLITLLKLTSGSTTVNGLDMPKDPKKVRSSIGIVFWAPSDDTFLQDMKTSKFMPCFMV